MNDLTEFGFKDESQYLHCRICGKLITKTIGSTLLGTPVKYGICKKWSHGATVCKVV